MSRCSGFLLIHVWDVFKSFLLVFHFLLKEFRMTQMKRDNCDCVCLDATQASSCAVATATCLTCGRRDYVIWLLNYLWIQLLAQTKYCTSMHFLLPLLSGSLEVHLRIQEIMQLVDLSFCCLVIHACEFHPHF